MQGLRAVFSRELTGYFSTPVAYVVLAIFLLISGACTFYLGNFFERGQADLQPFFMWHPWLYLFFIPAITMRLWAEERRSGTLELLLTLPVPLWQMVAGKFLAAWLFTAIALLGTLPLVITVSWLGDPDGGVIVSGYAASLLMAGGYLAIGSCMSALTRNQVIAFILSITLCFLFMLSGFPLVLNVFQGWLPAPLLDAIAGFSFLTNFQEGMKGVLDLSSILYFLSLILLWLFFTLLAVEGKKA